MPDVKEVTVTTRNPSGPGDVGSCEVGHYKVDGDLLTLVDAGGVPLRTNSGERITARLAAGDEARRVAYRLTLARWRNERDRNELVPGFNGPLHQSEPYGGY
jgi:hypothetical protein